MKYPTQLLTNGRDKLDRVLIKSDNLLFARHKPGYDWNDGEDLPDFTKIKLDTIVPENNQSLNWDKFSEPKWVRFNTNQEYQKDYAVIGYLTASIRNISKANNNLTNDLIDVEHNPIDLNYSHCQLECLEKLKSIEGRKKIKSIKRLLRMALKHNAVVLFKPGEE